MIRKFGKTLAATIVAATLTFSPALGLADEGAGEQCGASRAGGIALDLLVGRPTLVLATVAGALFYTIALPITLPSGAERDARDRFVTTPWEKLISPLGGE
ncbi:MAG: hypothetical protein VCC00_15445 [Deltaproteobacteria bacterium]